MGKRKGTVFIRVYGIHMDDDDVDDDEMKLGGRSICYLLFIYPHI